MYKTSKQIVRERDFILIRVICHFDRWHKDRYSVFAKILSFLAREIKRRIFQSNVLRELFR